MKMKHFICNFIYYSKEQLKLYITLSSKNLNSHPFLKHQATYCKNDSANNREPRLGSLTSPGVFTGPSSLRLSFVPVDAILPQRENFSRYWKCQKRGRSVFCFQAGQLFRERYPILTRKMGEGHWCRGKLLWWLTVLVLYFYD